MTTVLPTFMASVSGGLVSYGAARRVVERHGRDGLAFVFADTLIEDEDLYRFLIESSAALLGCDTPDVRRLAESARLIPTVESGDLDGRKAALSTIRDEATALVPGLHWIADGRTPWEVFRDERFIGNSRVDPCSKLLKRKLINAWRDEHCDPATTTLVFGMDWSERHRIEGSGKKKGHRRRMAEAGWKAIYPLDERPYLTRDDLIAQCRADGIEPPRLYSLGFPHNNCGGFCCKMGHAQARHLARSMTARYEWHAAQESGAMAAIGPTAKPFLRRRSGGETQGITMAEFRRSADAAPLFDGDGWGCGGGCAIDDDES